MVDKLHTNIKFTSTLVSKPDLKLVYDPDPWAGDSANVVGALTYQDPDGSGAGSSNGWDGDGAGADDWGE